MVTDDHTADIFLCVKLEVSIESFPSHYFPSSTPQILFTYFVMSLTEINKGNQIGMKTF